MCSAIGLFRVGEYNGVEIWNNRDFSLDGRVNDMSPGTVLKGKVLKRSLKVAAVVGTLLIAINQGDRIIAGDGIDWLKALLTYLVPFCVATYGAWTALRDRP